MATEYMRSERGEFFSISQFEFLSPNDRVVVESALGKTIIDTDVASLESQYLYQRCTLTVYIGPSEAGREKIYNVTELWKSAVDIDGKKVYGIFAIHWVRSAPDKQ